jgi:hypothetical protein
MSIEELYEKCKRFGIPVEKWPTWIEAELTKGSGNEIPMVGFSARFFFFFWIDSFWIIISLMNFFWTEDDFSGRRIPILRFFTNLFKFQERGFW